MKNLLVLSILFSFNTMADDLVKNEVSCDVKVRTSTSHIDGRGRRTVHRKQNEMFSYTSFPTNISEIAPMNELIASSYDSKLEEYVDSKGAVLQGTSLTFTKDKKIQTLYGFEYGHLPSDKLKEGHFVKLFKTIVGEFGNESYFITVIAYRNNKPVFTTNLNLDQDKRYDAVYYNIPEVAQNNFETSVKIEKFENKYKAGEITKSELRSERKKLKKEKGELNSKYPYQGIDMDCSIR